MAISSQDLYNYDGMPPPTRKHINWGGVVKGVAVVAAVAVVGVVGFYAATAGLGLLGAAVTDPTAIKLAAGVVEGGTTVFSWLGGVLSDVGVLATKAWVALPETLGLTSTLATPAVAGSVSTLKAAIGIGGAGAATALASGFAVKTLANTPLTTIDATSIDPSAHSVGILTSMKTGVATSLHGMEHATHASHLAGEHAHHANYNPTNTSHSGWTDKVASKIGLGSHPSSSQNISTNHRSASARDANFANQLDNDRKNLEAVLSK